MLENYFSQCTEDVSLRYSLEKQNKTETKASLSLSLSVLVTEILHFQFSKNE
jgi:hypothetical protein